MSRGHITLDIGTILEQLNIDKKKWASVEFAHFSASGHKKSPTIVGEACCGIKITIASAPHG